MAKIEPTDPTIKAPSALDLPYDARRNTLFGSVIDAPPKHAPSSPPEFSDSEIIALASAYPAERIPTSRKPAYSDLAVRQVYQQVASSNRVSFRTAVVGVHQLLRKGAANSGSPGSLSVEVFCPDTNRTVVLTKGELSIFICKCDGYSKDDKNECRTFAESVAIVACTIAQTQILAKPNLSLDVLAGDLYGKINRGLIAANQPKLSPSEAVWCCSYCQNVNNLNELAKSERLEQLLTKDLDQRLAANKKKVAVSGVKGTKRGQTPQKAKDIKKIKAAAKTKPGIGPRAMGGIATENS